MTRAVRTIVVIAAAVVAIAVIAPYWTAAMLITRAAAAPRWLVPVAHWTSSPVSDSIEQISLPPGTLRARVFRPDAAASRSVLLVSGVHPDGIEDPRLVSLARELAATGVVVLAPEIDDLIHYRLTPRVTDTIEALVQWMSTRPDLFGAGRIGLIGVSFSGGLSIVAAGRPSVRDRIAFVLSFGGHGNLPRVLRYLCTGEGAPSPPHDYALAVLLHQAADLAAPPAQVQSLRDGIETFLEASALAQRDPEKAAGLFDAARSLQHEIPEPSASLLKYVTDRNVAALGPRLVPYLNELGQDPALSPDRSPAPAAPVYLLHGADDNVIPAMETTRLSEHLRGKTEVRQLVTGFLTHVDVTDRPGAADTWDMIDFWKAILAER